MGTMNGLWQNSKRRASAGSRTRVDCLEGNHANRYTTDAATEKRVLDHDLVMGLTRVATLMQEFKLSIHRSMHIVFLAFFERKFLFHAQVPRKHQTAKNTRPTMQAIT